MDASSRRGPPFHQSFPALLLACSAGDGKALGSHELSLRGIADLVQAAASPVGATSARGLSLWRRKRSPAHRLEGEAREEDAQKENL